MASIEIFFFTTFPHWALHTAFYFSLRIFNFRSLGVLNSHQVFLLDLIAPAAKIMLREYSKRWLRLEKANNGAAVKIVTSSIILRPLPKHEPTKYPNGAYFPNSISNNVFNSFMKKSQWKYALEKTYYF